MKHARVCVLLIACSRDVTPVEKLDHKPAVTAKPAAKPKQAPPRPAEVQHVTIKALGMYCEDSCPLKVRYALADLTAGTYYGPSNQQELATIYDALSLQLVVEPEKTEVTALFAGAGILALLIGGICSMLWFSRIP